MVAWDCSVKSIAESGDEGGTVVAMEVLGGW